MPSRRRTAGYRSALNQRLVRSESCGLTRSLFLPFVPGVSQLRAVQGAGGRSASTLGTKQKSSAFRAEPIMDDLTFRHGRLRRWPVYVPLCVRMKLNGVGHSGANCRMGCWRTPEPLVSERRSGLPARRRKNTLGNPFRPGGQRSALPGHSSRRNRW